MKMIIFDMDGTIANFYNVPNWLADIRAENPAPYINAEPLYNMQELNCILNALKLQGWTIGVTTWTAMGASKEFNKAVATAKKEWLQKYNFPADEIHVIKYGTTKANCTRNKGGYQILVDDNEKIRKGWKLGATIDANKDILAELRKLLKEE